MALVAFSHSIHVVYKSCGTISKMYGNDRQSVARSWVGPVSMRSHIRNRRPYQSVGMAVVGLVSAIRVCSAIGFKEPCWSWMRTT